MKVIQLQDGVERELDWTSYADYDQIGVTANEAGVRSAGQFVRPESPMSAIA
jgi:hypothetical protein